MNVVTGTPPTAQLIGSGNAQSPELSVVVPTFKEHDNILPLIKLLDEALAGIAWEVIFVDDDSPDATAALIREIGRARANVRIVHRVGRRGLSTAVIEGMLASSAPYLGVIDADMQHDEKLLPRMLQILLAGDADVVVGSRFIDGGGIGNWDKTRASMSRLATKLSRLIVKNDLSDPMSGFFMITRPAFESAVRRLSGEGYKILLDVFASATQPLRLVELPYQFRNRVHGESKVDSLVLWEYVALILDKMIGWLVSPRLIMFGAVGGSGVVVHFAIFALAFGAFGTSFVAAQVIGSVVAMTSNYLLNNMLTYRDRRLTGARFWTGLFSFYVVCSIGLTANVGIANFAYLSNTRWWLASTAGVIVGVVWNYAASRVLTWRQR